MTYLSFGLLVLTVLVLTTASFVEKVVDTETAHHWFYGSLPFIVLWLLLAIVALVAMLGAWNMMRRPALLLFHCSFAFILLGAGLTHFFGTQGDMYLYRGQPVSSFTTSDGKREPLPFTVRLRKFEIVYFPGTQSPMDFVSRVSFDGDGEQQVSMNHIAQNQHYRFYQSGYDLEREGVHLSVAHDPWGIFVTYIGYALLLCGILALLLHPKEGFRHAWRNVMKYSNSWMIVLALLLSLPLRANDKSLPKTLPTAQAERFGNLYVYHNGRICPMQTLARDFTTKLYGHDRYKGYSAVQVLVGWMLYPTDWVNQSMIKVSGHKVREALDAKGTYVSWRDYMDDTNQFKLTSLVDELNRGVLKGNEANDVSAAYEKYNIIASLMSGSAVRMFPISTNGTLNWVAQGDRLPETLPHDEWLFIKRSTDYIMELALTNDYAGLDEVLDKIRLYQQKKGGAYLPSATRFRAEQLYNSLQFSLPLAVFLVLLGVVYYVLVVRSWLNNHSMSPLVRHCGRWLLFLATVFLSTVIVLRGYSGGYIPLSNGYETMQFMAFCVLLIALLLCRRLSLFMPFGFLMGGLALMVSMMGENNPQITTLMPVLASPLLSFHVAIIMFAYSLLAFLFFNGITALVLWHSENGVRLADRLSDLSRLILYPAVFLLALGIFIGAVWANVSWGRYWGWDPKETWALIAMMVYAVSFHRASLPAFRRSIFFHLYLVLAFLTVLMTYFGVNFLLGGLHSYA